MVEELACGNDALDLYTLLADYPSTSALRKGIVSSPLVRFNFADVTVSNTAFKPLVRECRFDVGELALVTYLQAKTFGTPYILLPAVVVARGQHQTMLYNPERGGLSLEKLAGRRVGVRAYTQTTGVWVRGILQDDYGVDISRIRWVTFEDPHVAEYQDPPWIERAPEGKDLLQMLLEGEVDAGIFGGAMPGTPLKQLIPEAEVAAQNWAEKHGGIPINHMIVVRQSIARSRPDVVHEVYRLLRESRDVMPPGKGREALRFGIEPTRSSLETLIDYSFRQGLIPQRLTVDELFDDQVRRLCLE